MKNIHLIPTDKPSVLIKDFNNKFLLTNGDIQSLRDGYQFKHIYITSDDEIKTDNWYLDDTNSVRQAITECESYWTHRKKYQKIILTTDQDLIKDGVRAIDDTFLEWFVKNPSCESVETVIEKMFPMYESFPESINKPPFYGNLKYKIIIPKEEPKQELERGIIITHIGKQETLEEAAERLYPFALGGIGNVEVDKKNHFIKGAKWQQEQDKIMYSKLSIYLQELADKDRLKSLTSNQIRTAIEQFKKK